MTTPKQSGCSWIMASELLIWHGSSFRSADLESVVQWAHDLSGSVGNLNLNDKTQYFVTETIHLVIWCKVHIPMSNLSPEAFLPRLRTSCKDARGIWHKLVSDECLVVQPKPMGHDMTWESHLMLQFNIIQLQPRHGEQLHKGSSLAIY